MSLNQYNVRAYLKTFHEMQSGQKIADCQVSFDKERNQYFISTIVSANSNEEAKQKGIARIQQVLNVAIVYSGIYYELVGLTIDQISGEEPFISTMPLLFRRLRLLPLHEDHLKETRKSIDILDRISEQQLPRKRAEKAIKYFTKGCYFNQADSQSEAFLNFYKSIELVSHDFRKAFDDEINKQLTDTLLKDLTDFELKDLRTPKRLIQFTCEELETDFECEIPSIVRLRNEFSAHASLKEVVITQEEFNDCKTLAAKVIINYINYIQKSKSTPPPP